MNVPALSCGHKSTHDDPANVYPMASSMTPQLKAVEEELTRRASAAIGSPGSGVQADDSDQVAHLKAENSRLRKQMQLAWAQVGLPLVMEMFLLSQWHTGDLAATL